MAVTNPKVGQIIQVNTIDGAVYGVVKAIRPEDGWLEILWEVTAHLSSVDPQWVDLADGPSSKQEPEQ